jgi:CheY-like chemotaxis protein
LHSQTLVRNSVTQSLYSVTLYADAAALALAAGKADVTAGYLRELKETAQETPAGRIRVLVVDDHAIVRKGIRALLAETPGFEIVEEAANGQDAVARAEELRPDVILMDLLMPVMDGIEATRQISSSQPQSRILVLTSFAADNNVFPAIKAGAVGYLLKDSPPEDLVRAIRQVHLASRTQAALYAVREGLADADETLVEGE